MKKIFGNVGISRNYGCYTPYGVHTDKITDNVICINNDSEEAFEFTADGEISSVFFSEKTKNVFVIDSKKADILKING